MQVFKNARNDAVDAAADERGTHPWTSDGTLLAFPRRRHATRTCALIEMIEIITFSRSERPPGRRCVSPADRSDVIRNAEFHTWTTASDGRPAAAADSGAALAGRPNDRFLGRLSSAIHRCRPTVSNRYRRPFPARSRPSDPQRSIYRYGHCGHRRRYF